MKIIRVLIVEDDRQIAEIQQRFIERISHVTLCGIAHTLVDARDQIDVFKPDLVLLDVYFPDGNGLDLLREMRAGDSASDVILITAAKEVETLRSALRGGVFDYILKPLVFERLQEAIQNYRLHLDTLAGLQSVGQKAVDTLLPRAPADQAADSGGRLPKGIDHLTLDKIREVVRRPGDWSADAVGLEIGASRTTARRYLEYLASTSELTAEVSYGAVGRPERKYRWLAG